MKCILNCGIAIIRGWYLLVIWSIEWVQQLAISMPDVLDRNTTPTFYDIVRHDSASVWIHSWLSRGTTYMQSSHAIFTSSDQTDSQNSHLIHMSVCMRCWPGRLPFERLWTHFFSQFCRTTDSIGLHFYKFINLCSAESRSWNGICATYASRSCKIRVFLTILIHQSWNYFRK
jgi:hypothetical protein